MTKTQLIGNRVVLRAFRLSDAKSVRDMAGNRSVADNRMSIPHPYEDGMAEEWISGLAPRIERGELASFAVVEKVSDQLIGEVSLRIDRRSNEATLSYWIGEPYWGLGYCTEAASLMVRHGFEDLRLGRIRARYAPKNVPSGRVLQKVGMRYEGRSRRFNTKLGRPEDLALYGLSRDRWLNISPPGPIASQGDD